MDLLFSVMVTEMERERGARRLHFNNKDCLQNLDG